jgi:hypothetical protein
MGRGKTQGRVSRQNRVRRESKDPAKIVLQESKKGHVRGEKSHVSMGIHTPQLDGELPELLSEIPDESI